LILTANLAVKKQQIRCIFAVKSTARRNLQDLVIKNMLHTEDGRKKNKLCNLQSKRLENAEISFSTL